MATAARKRSVHFFTGYSGGVAATLRRDGDAVLPEAERLADDARYLQSQATAVLASTGGYSRGEAGGIRFGGDLLEVGKALAEAHGDFRPATGAARYTHGNWSENQLPAATVVRASVEHAVIRNGGRKVAFGSVSFSMTGVTRSDSGDRPAITVQAAIEGFSIDGHNLTVRIAAREFLNTGSLDDLRLKLQDAKFARFARQLIVPGGLDTYREPPRRFPKTESVYGTVVDSIKWENPNTAPTDVSFPDRHRVVIPGWGKLILGELLISSATKKIAMVRAELGSPWGAELEMVFGGENGGGWPP